MNIKEFDEKLENWEEILEKQGNTESYDIREAMFDECDENEFFTKVMGVPCKILESEREDAQFITILKVGDDYFRNIGQYDSWNGTEIDEHNWEQVVPYEKVVTFYKRK